MVTVPQLPGGIVCSRGWGQTKLTCEQIKTDLHLMGPCGDTNEVPSERCGEAGLQLSLAPVTQCLTATSVAPSLGYGMAFC